MFRFGFRMALGLVFAACCVFSFVMGRVGFGWFFAAMSGAYLVAGVLERRSK